jgi:hypothetical protein
VNEPAVASSSSSVSTPPAKKTPVAQAPKPSSNMESMILIETKYRELATSRQLRAPTDALPKLLEVISQANELESRDRLPQAIKFLNQAVDLRILRLNVLEVLQEKNDIRSDLMMILLVRAKHNFTIADRKRSAAILDLVKQGKSKNWINCKISSTRSCRDNSKSTLRRR